MKHYLILLLLALVVNEPINVHIIPHTHDDAGWLVTYEEYYTGNNRIGKCVKCILDNMLISLKADEKRTFTYVEMAFFEKWYKDLSQADRDYVKQLVKEGRLEFINGGWVMNDEAAANYQDIIDQMRLGLLFLDKEFGVRLKTAWFIDPFGHSLTNVCSVFNFRLICYQNLVLKI